MQRLAPFAAVTVALLALAAPAAAKEVAAAKACGASECREVKDRELLAVLPQGSEPTNPPRNPSGGWYRVTITIRGDGAFDRFTVAALPGARFLRDRDPAAGRYVWMPMTDAAARAYREIVRGLEPLPISSLRGLDQKLPRQHVIVDEVVDPHGAAAAAASREGGFPWGWVAGGLGAIALAGGALVTLRRRRGGSLRRPGPQAAG